MTGEAGCERRINDAKIWSARHRPYISTVMDIVKSKSGKAMAGGCLFYYAHHRGHDARQRPLIQETSTLTERPPQQ